MFDTFKIPISWFELVKRTGREFVADDCFGLAAQLAYYFFLALFPALLFLIGLASFFSLSSVTDQALGALGSFAPPDVLRIIEEQMHRLSESEDGGILTLGFVGALWSSSAAMVSIVSSLNRAYDIEEGRPWWKTRLVSIALTVALALLVVVSFMLVLAGPTLAESVAARFGLGAAFEWTWKVLQWPLAFALVTVAIGIVFYFGPDAEQAWEWVSPGAVAATALWLLISLGFKMYIANFTDYSAAYGAVGGVIVLLLWFYVSGLALLVGAEMNAEIEHASPHGKDPGEKRPGEKKKLGRVAAAAYRKQRAASVPPSGSSVETVSV
ncbi:MAG: YihY/virulence factor BrkB family protein [Acidobacteria bacterium]|nr:YihY/virulence factor BrkB family protein [Acidobacteriota bacterium]